LNHLLRLSETIHPVTLNAYRWKIIKGKLITKRLIRIENIDLRIDTELEGVRVGDTVYIHVGDVISYITAAEWDQYQKKEQHVIEDSNNKMVTCNIRHRTLF
jgi:hydrogenase maturation factor